MRIWSVSLFLKTPYCTSSSWWREVIKSLWDEITWGEWHGHHDACWAIIDLLTVCQEEDPLLPNSKLTAGNWNHRKCNHREGRLLYLVSVMTVILNLLFLLYLRLVSAIFALLTLQFQLPHHIPSVIVTNQMVLVENTALLAFWHLRRTPQSVPLYHTEGKDEQFHTQEIRLTNEVNRTFMGEAPQRLRMHLKRTASENL